MGIQRTAAGGPAEAATSSESRVTSSVLLDAGDEASRKLKATSYTGRGMPAGGRGRGPRNGRRERSAGSSWT